MGLIWKENENEFLIRYQKIRRYFKMFRNNQLSGGEYENLKTQQFNIDGWQASICTLEDKPYNSIMIEALIDLHELYNDGAITKTELESELHKVRLRPPIIEIPPDFFK